MAALLAVYVLLNLIFIIYATHVPSGPPSAGITGKDGKDWLRLRLDPNRVVHHNVDSNTRGLLGCLFLEYRRPDLVHFQNDTLYKQYNSVYISRLARTEPTCIFSPANSEDVSVAMTTIHAAGVPYNVVSGGGNTIPGLAGVDKGILVTTALLDSIELDEKTGLVRVGAGCRWGKVYSFLEKRGLTVLGARAPNVGVSGFLLGGGISFHTNKFGFGCDYVESYELVTVNGTILQVNKVGPHRDLFFGLKGAGSNFGIVTRFDIRTIPSSPSYGGSIRMQGKPRDDALDAILDFYRKSSDTIESQAIFAYTHNYPLGNEYTDISVFRTDYKGKGGAPPAELKRIVELKADSVTIKPQSVASLMVEMSEQAPDSDSRRELRGFSVKLDGGLFRDILKIFMNEIAAVRGDAWIPTIAFQYLPDTAAYMSKRRGGNMLGINGDFAFITLGAYWTDVSLDKRILRAMDSITRSSIELASARGLSEPFAYYNYAPPMLDPIQSYGSTNIKKLQALKDRYDPHNQIKKLLYGAHRIPDST